ncbi:MAG: hypothetical protein IRY84_15475 [Thermobispora bispora]|nr:hypothetical protein [Thermobispora bispora]
MDQHTGSDLLGLIGLEVFEVDVEETGSRRVHVLPAGVGGRICPACRIMAVRPKQWTTQTVTHVRPGR